MQHPSDSRREFLGLAVTIRKMKLLKLLIKNSFLAVDTYIYVHNLPFMIIIRIWFESELCLSLRLYLRLRIFVRIIYFCAILYNFWHILGVESQLQRKRGQHLGESFQKKSFIHLCGGKINAVSCSCVSKSLRFMEMWTFKKWDF